MEILLGHSPVILLPDRALLLPESQSLIIADLHLGKSATFRRQGLPVPEGSTKADLARLSTLIETQHPTQLIIAGDLVHSSLGLSPDITQTFLSWLSRLSIPLSITEGNHDSHAALSKRQLPLKILPHLHLDGLLITHDPADLPAGQSGIAGHLHPAAKIGPTRRGKHPHPSSPHLRLPGFYLKNNEHLILPAFSEFTGTHPIRFQENDHFYTELRGHISEIPPTLLR